MKFTRPIAALACLALWAVPAGASAAVHNAHRTAHSFGAGNPELGPNVITFTPSMSQASIQAELNAISTQQVPNQFGTQRYSIFFEPGTYGSASDPLDFQVGFYTQVAGLGEMPGDVVINGAINIFNQCVDGQCEGTDNFWRSLSNLTLNVDMPSSPPAYAPDPGDVYGDGCDNSGDLWAASQADPMRRVIVNGTLQLQDYCAPGPSQGDVSGGYFADDQFTAPPATPANPVPNAVGDDGNQQYFTRNSTINGPWSNGVWNQVFLGDSGAPATDFTPGTQYTNVGSTPVSEEEPFLYTDNTGDMRVFVPAVQHNSVGTSYASGTEAGNSEPISDFFVANPNTPDWEINAALLVGRNLIFTPGVYNVSQTIEVDHPNTIVLGLGFATLIPEHGIVTMRTAGVPGIKLSGLIFDAGPQNSPVLLQLGDEHGGPGGFGRFGNDGRFGDSNDPTLVQDVFFRIGGAEPGKATTALEVNDNNTILDDIWAWRADHGNGVGWTANTANTGLIVNGNNVDAYGLAVEHFQKDEVIWNGQNGEDVFFQNEMPYDPPSQAAWMASPTFDGYPAFLVSNKVKSFQGYGMGSYSYFDQGVPIFASDAFVAPDTAGVQFHDLLTIFLNASSGEGGIDNVINGEGGPSTITNPDTPVDVTTYP